ncbi:MAG TPA: hypothetical protein VM120_12390 [Bryobacteraceae bacterium]|nr:hypothetical protein [Bryobacteraceae bacterium]
MRALLGTFVIFFVLLARSSAQVTVGMSQYDYERTGANLHEWILHPSTVNSAGFAKLFSRNVDASVYALPLIVPNLNIAGERRNVLFVATMANTVYAFDADDPARVEPYWSKNLGTPAPGDSWIGPVYHGILSTPFIDVSTGTLYTVTMVGKDKKYNLLAHALDIFNGTPKYNSPQLLSFPFAGAETLTNVKGALQRAGLLMRDDVLYIAFANIVPDPNDQHWSQEGFVESFNARDLSQRLAVFQSTPTGRKGGIWQSGRGIASDAAGNIYVATAGGKYDGITNFGSSVLKFAPRSLRLTDWFTPKNHEFLFLQNIDLSAGGVTLIPNSQLMFAGGKEGVIFLLNRETMGKLEGENAGPLQRFKATTGCGQKDCAQTLGTAFWARKNDGVLYVWDRNDFLYAYDFVNERFVTTPSAVSKEKRGMNGGPALSANGSGAGTGIVWVATTQSTKNGGLSPGTLRAFLASNIGQELYNSDINAARDALGDFTKFAPPVVANGKVYVPTQSKAVVVYGLLCGKDVSPLVQVQTGKPGARKNETYVQPITVRNTSTHAIGGPFEIAVDNLTPGVTLSNATGVTSCAKPGSPVMRATGAPLWLLPGASFSTAMTVRTTSTIQRLKIRVLAGHTAAASH